MLLEVLIFWTDGHPSLPILYFVSSVAKVLMLTSLGTRETEKFHIDFTYSVMYLKKV